MYYEDAETQMAYIFYKTLIDNKYPITFVGKSDRITNLNSVPPRRGAG